MKILRATASRHLGSILWAVACVACAHATEVPAPLPSATGASEAAGATRSAAPGATPTAPASASELLARERAPFDACYARARTARPDLRRTTVEITFTLDDAGKPMTVDLQYRNRMDEDAKACLRTAALALQFPASLRGKQTGTISFEAR